MDVIDLCSSCSEDDDDNDDDDTVPKQPRTKKMRRTADQYPNHSVIHIDQDEVTTTGTSTGTVSATKVADNHNVHIDSVIKSSSLINPYIRRSNTNPNTKNINKIIPSQSTPNVAARTDATTTTTQHHTSFKDIHPIRVNVVFPHHNDSAIATNGIIPLLCVKYVPNETTGVVLSCTSTMSGMLHIQQKDKWSCGYRNLQMILSAVLPDLSLQQQKQPQHQQYCVPSLKDIQETLEELWSKGYDRMGAEHYQYRIQNQCQWIGAVEVANYLSYQYRIDTTVIEFILCHESRSLLSSFCRCYFAKQSPTQHGSTCPYCNQFDDRIDASSSSSYAANTVTMARDILQSIENSNNMTIPTCTCPTQPLYLQWNGHSVTIIGIEQHTNHLLIMDPKCNGSKIKKALLPPSKPQSQRPTPLPSVLRLSTLDLLPKDCQIIVTSTHNTLSPSQLDHIQRYNVPSIIAANDAVMKIRRTQPTS